MPLPDTMTSPTASRRRDIQGLRALAVLAVIGAHAAGWPRGGFAGVDVFFVISGFVITGALLREQRSAGRISLARFYARRARRLLPAAVITIAAVVGTSFAVFHRARADQILGDGVAALLLASNWRFAAQGSDYFAATTAVSPLQHFWSLSVEEQFYLVWPGLLIVLLLLVPRAARAGRRAAILVGVASAVVVVASFGIAVVQSAQNPLLAYFSTATRAWEFAVGAFLAAAAPLARRLPAAMGGLLALAGTVGIVAALFVLEPSGPGFPGPWAALPVGATVLVIVGGAVAPRAMLLPLTNPVSVFTGDASYSLYLWHFPVVVFAAAVVPVSAWSLPVILAATAVLGIASYLLVEQPLRYAPFLGARLPAAPPAASSASDAAPTGLVTAESAPSASIDQLVAASRPDTVSEPAPSAFLSRRPEGWQPGTRYFPGAVRPASVPAVDSPVASVSPAPAPAPAARAVPPPPVPPASDDAGRSSIDAWRERFGSQMTLTAAALVVAGLLGVLYAQNLVAPNTSPAAGQSPPTVAAPGDPTAALQSDLAAAAAATTWPELHPSLDEVMAQSSGANPARACFSPSPAPSAPDCTWGSPDAPHHLYLVGDSTAMAYAPALRELAQNSGGAIRVTTVGLYGCRFTDVLVQNDDPDVMNACPGRKADVAAMIAADRPEAVLVSNAYTLAQTADGRDLSASDLAGAEAAEVASYDMAGRVVFLAAPPEGAPLGNCYTQVGSPYACATSVNQTWTDIQAAMEQMAAARGEHVMDSRPFTCWNDVCPAFAGTLPIRYDQTHLTVDYSAHIAPYLWWWLTSNGVVPPS
ncbi:acyltransferase family protein [Microbacterium sp.]|uniref:acyltransferase family protein n=1 Tax=Microbacterium sp. TaxID=51671 RepID=UPI0025E21411|nr:acyltransferase family protein [Microbacterium sp.]